MPYAVPAAASGAAPVGLMPPLLWQQREPHCAPALLLPATPPALAYMTRTTVKGVLQAGQHWADGSWQCIVAFLVCSCLQRPA